MILSAPFRTFPHFSALNPHPRTAPFCTLKSFRTLYRTPPPKGGGAEVRKQGAGLGAANFSHRTFPHRT